MMTEMVYALAVVLGSMVTGLVLTGLCALCGLFGGGVIRWEPSELRRQQAAQREEMHELSWGMEPGGMAEELASQRPRHQQRRLSQPLLTRLRGEDIRYVGGVRR